MSIACISRPLAIFLPTPQSPLSSSLLSSSSISLDSPKKLRKPILKAWRKRSPTKKKQSIISDGESRHSGSFYEWQPGPKRHEKTREAEAHHFCHRHLEQYDKFLDLRSDELVQMEAKDVIVFGNWLLDHGFVPWRTTCDSCGAACTLQRRANVISCPT